MTYRELFHEIMYYGEFDRMPVLHWTGWPETRQRWLQEGLPADKSEHEFFNALPMWAGVGVHLGLMPGFEYKVLEETDEYRIVQEGDGVISQQWKNKSCIPHFIDYTLKSAKEWDDFKKRLQPDPARIPANLDQTIESLKNSTLPVCISTASLMGWIRNWMGVQNMCYLMYDDRDVYADMVMTIADLVCWQIDIILPKLKVDFGFGWEDICGKAGPLVSPTIFDECVAPGYLKIRNKLEEYGVDLYGIDTDGDIRALIGHWLDAGVNLQFPIEVGPFKGNALEYRKMYGKELRVIGNFDKLALEKGHSAIEAEIQRLLPLMKEGGFIILPDHLITPGTPLKDYQWYLERVRELRF